MKKAITFIGLLALFIGISLLGSLTFEFFIFIDTLGLPSMLTPILGVMPMIAVMAAYSTWMIHRKERK
ncbi:hypothetical protein [Pseudomonas juntendi]|uniref:hypothetical protein n=1 Tax=Pseudomonas juntendi TaxID=2666183 RepID=UPI003B43C748